MRIRKSERTDKPIARFLLGATEPSQTNGTHLDENDLVLMELNALSDHERAVIREHLHGCLACRKLAGEILSGAARRAVAVQPAGFEAPSRR